MIIISNYTLNLRLRSSMLSLPLPLFFRIVLYSMSCPRSWFSGILYWLDFWFRSVPFRSVPFELISVKCRGVIIDNRSGETLDEYRRLRCLFLSVHLRSFATRIWLVVAIVVLPTTMAFLSSRMYLLRPRLVNAMFLPYYWLYIDI